MKARCPKGHPLTHNNKSCLICMGRRKSEVVGWLVVHNGKLKGRDFPLFRGANMIGTNKGCHIVLPDPYVDPQHAVVTFDNDPDADDYGGFNIYDLQSKNGTFVNRQKVHHTDLINCDGVRLGQTELVFKSLY